MTGLPKTKPSPWLFFPPKFHNCVLLKRFPFFNRNVAITMIFYKIYQKVVRLFRKRSYIYIPFNVRLFSFAQCTISINIINKKVITKCFFILAANYDNSLSSTNYFKRQNREINLQLSPEIHCIYSSFNKKKNFLHAWYFKIRILDVYFYIHDQKTSSKYQSISFLFLWHV